ncbi:T9SS type A sorting domain-containing protein, partial [Salinivirga cyanobacteriivorans]
VLEVRDETGTSTVAAYEAPLATLGLDDAAITVLASGFLNPANNSDGEAFGLYVALPSGGQLVALSAVGIFDNPQSTISLNVYPNPTSDRLNIASDSSIEKVEIFNAQGQIVIQRAANADKLSLNISDLTEGTYFVRVQSNNNVGVERIIKQ